MVTKKIKDKNAGIASSDKNWGIKSRTRLLLDEKESINLRVFTKKWNFQEQI